MADVLRVAQLSDTHFLERGLDAEGGHGYDTSEAFDAVLDDLSDRDIDLVVQGAVASPVQPVPLMIARRRRDRCST